MTKSLDPTPWGNIAVRNKALALLKKTKAIAPMLPVRLTKVLEAIGYDYTEFSPDRETQGILGAISYANKTIYINKDEAEENKHLTLAHEIGHAILHPKESIIDLRVFSQDGLTAAEILKEREANVFAHELIMPISEFIEAYERNNGDTEVLAKQFLVPVKNVFKRIEFLKKQVSEKKIDDFESIKD